MGFIEITKKTGRALAVTAAIVAAVSLSIGPSPAYAQHRGGGGWHGGGGGWHGGGGWRGGWGHRGGGWGGAGIGFGILGGALAGAAIANSYYGYGYPYDYYGGYGYPYDYYGGYGGGYSPYGYGYGY